MKHVIFYHLQDFDGECSAAIAIKFFKENNLEYDLRPHNHDIPLNFREISLEDKVYFLDIVPTPYNYLSTLYKEGYNITIIDHHLSFIKTGLHEQAKDYLCRTDKSACELTWEYFFKEKQIPKFVSLLGRYDIWDKTQSNWETEILSFQYGLRTYQTKPIDSVEIWEKLFSDSKQKLLKKVIDEGEHILTYDKKNNQQLAERFKFEATYKGLKFLCLNTPSRSSAALEYFYNPEIHDAMFVFSFNGKEWGGSFYTTKDIDLSKLAVKLGGGGHKQACGFPFYKFKVSNGKLKIYKNFFF